jgi:MFS family permease
LYSGSVQAAQALATLAILPLAGRLSDKIGPRPIALVGLIVLTGAAALLTSLTLTTPIAIVVGILFLLGCAGGLTSQIPVAAMSQIRSEEQQAIANSSTLMSVLRASAAPLGVAMLSSLMQAQSEQYRISLAAQGITGELVTQQSALLAMHDSFLVASCVALVGFAAMYCVPKRNPLVKQQSEHAQIEEGSMPL